MSLTEQIKEYALNIGYSKVGIIPADSFSEFIAELTNRQDMYSFYINGRAHPIRSAEPRSVMPNAKSVITVIYDYSQKSFPKELSDRIGRLYLARCYEAPPDLINGTREELMKEFLRKLGCEVADNIHLPERLAAVKAGIATVGKNTFAYTDGIGSFIYLTSFVIDVELDYDESSAETGCPEGCCACMEACPTQAIYEPYKMNPHRCIAFQTFLTQDRIAGSYIEPEMREKIGGLVHGCDICQEVCPRNKERLSTKLLNDEFLLTIAKDFNLAQVLNMTDEFYHTRVRPIMFNHISEKKYFQRNAAIALGNLGDPAFVPDLAVAMKDPEALVRSYAAWALGKIGNEQAKKILQESLSRETSEAVRREITEALLS